MLAALAPLLAERRPDRVLVYGDTNSTLAGALAAAQARIPVAHVEAGMRSFDRAMPEELNRVLTDHAQRPAALPVADARSTTCAREARRRARSSLVGDVMVDVAHALPAARAARRSAADAGVEPARTCWPPRTVRATSTTRRGWRALVDLLLAVPGARGPAAAPAHPRAPGGAGCSERLAAGVELLPPLGYLDFTSLLVHARAVLTDSGGVQKEAYLAGVPCVTLRDTTEWVETVDAGWNVLVDLDREAALAALQRTPPARAPASSTATGARASGSSAPYPLERDAAGVAHDPAAVDDPVGRDLERLVLRVVGLDTTPSTGSPSHGSKPSARSSASS